MTDVKTGRDVFDGPPISYPDPPVATKHRKSHRATPTGQRADIQGLRALAVVLVILDHVGSWPHGGFVGVDVFFVISGFLITGILLRAASGHRGGRYFGEFYKRRARRILPVSVLVLIVSWVAADLTFRGARIAQTHSDIWYALGFSANIHFSAIGTDYFQTGRPPSLVQHYWSLAVEEQFYLVWPVVVFVIFAVLARRGATTVLLATIGVLSAASFVWAIHETVAAPTPAYFSTLVRAWELGAGATVAVTLARWPALADRLGAARGPLALTGLLAIIASAGLISSAHSFPAPAAAWPVAGTALILLAGAGAAAGYGRWVVAITNPAARYLGDISYSLYLWHWPAIIILETLLPHRGVLLYPMVVLTTLGVSVFSYHFVEEPFRLWRRPRGARVGLPRIALAAVTLLVAAAGLYLYKPEPAVPHFVSAVDTQPAPAATDQASAAPARRAAILAALQATSFPHLTPSLNRLGLTAALGDWRGCNTETVVLPSCVTRPAVRDPKKVAMVVGDSISLAWLPAIRAALVPEGWTVYGVARQECPAAYVSRSLRGTTAERAAGCDRYHAFLSSAAAQVRPTLVVMSSGENAVSYLADNAAGARAISEYRQGMVKAAKLLSAPRRQVVILSPPPNAKPLLDCDAAGSAPSDCVATVDNRWSAQSGADAAAATEVHGRYVDTRLWFCSASGYCPPFVGSTPVFYDGEHLTNTYAASLGVDMRRALLG